MPATLAPPPAPHPTARRSPAPLRVLRADAGGVAARRWAAEAYMGDVEAEMEGAARWIAMTTSTPRG
jgi:hypothetical protein